MDRTSIYSLDRKKLSEIVAENKLQSFRVDQLLKWLYHDKVIDMSQMTNLPKSFRSWLSSNYSFDLPRLCALKHSKDGTKKWSVGLENGNYVEMVLIPERDRNTLCVSSQVGCALKCDFCSTGKQGFKANLNTAEIVGQLILANRHLSREGKRVSNIVFMGMGEPLLNFEAVSSAINLFQDDCAFGLSKRKVTLSTAGLVPGIMRMKETLDCSLAISLHAPTDSVRNVLVPVNRKYPIKDLLAAASEYIESRQSLRKLIIEYTLIEGVNDSPQDAARLAELLKPIKCKINLIPFNTFDGSDYKAPKDQYVKAFQRRLILAGHRAMIRSTRGSDIMAACGQLAELSLIDADESIDGGSDEHRKVALTFRESA